MSLDCWKFWTGQTLSNLGSSFTQWAVPLLVFQLTHSAVNLGVATAATFVPYLLFGLLLGAWMDRVDRKRAMIALDSLNAVVILSIPLVATFWHLSVWWIYGVTFIQSSVFIAFSAGAFAAASFVVSALSLASIRGSFNVAREGEAPDPTTILHDVAEGLRYVLSHPVLRNISLMMALINFVGATAYAQLVLFAKERLDAGPSRVGILFAAGSAGVVVTGLLAGRLRRRFSFTTVAMTALMLDGAMTTAFSAMRWFWPALVFWAAQSGFGILFNINTGSLRQAIVPSHLLSRVLSIASVLAWSAIPAGALVGGWIVAATGRVA